MPANSDRLSVYLPDSNLLWTDNLAPGTAIVGNPAPDLDDRIMVDYEGAVYDQVNLRRYADRVACAAGRQSVRYPTRARLWVKPETLRRIGEWDPLEGRVILDSPEDAAALAAYLGLADLGDEIESSDAHHEMRRSVRAAFASGDPAQHFAARLMARRYRLNL